MNREQTPNPGMRNDLMRSSIFRLALLMLLCAPVQAAAAKGSPHLVFMIGEDEYKTWETLPEFAKTELDPRGFRVSVIQADARDKNNFPGLVEALHDADLLFISLRRRTPPKEQLDAVRAHLNAGRPLCGIRTACHAFAPSPADQEKLPTNPRLAQWPEFDPEVLGGHYTGHHGPGSKVLITTALGAGEHPILQGVDVNKLQGNGSLYKVSPLSGAVAPLLIGAIPDKPTEPVAWTCLYGPKKARIFYTSLGHPNDFKNPEFRRLLLNGVRWACQ